MVIFFLDTNILWWYFVKDSKNHLTIKNFLDKLILNTQNSFTSTLEGETLVRPLRRR